MAERLGATANSWRAWLCFISSSTNGIRRLNGKSRRSLVSPVRAQVPFWSGIRCRTQLFSHAKRFSHHYGFYFVETIPLSTRVRFQSVSRRNTAVVRLFWFYSYTTYAVAMSSESHCVFMLRSRPKSRRRKRRRTRRRRRSRRRRSASDGSRYGRRPRPWRRRNTRRPPTGVGRRAAPETSVWTSKTDPEHPLPSVRRHVDANCPPHTLYVHYCLSTKQLGCFTSCWFFFNFKIVSRF